MLVIDHIFKRTEEDIVVKVIEWVFVRVEAEDELVVVFEDFLKGEARLGSVDVEDAGNRTNDDLVDSCILQQNRSFV